jgi:predicted acyltransferase
MLSGHTWSGAPAPGFDPEGILSTLPAVATTLLGVLAGHLLRSSLAGKGKSGWMLATGIGLIALGLIMDNWLPINKNLWTSSYAVFTAGWAALVLAGAYWIIDVKGSRKWAHPFVLYGVNALAIFALSGIAAKLLYLIRWTAADGSTVTLKSWIYEGFFLRLASPINASLLFAVGFVLAGWLVAGVMWRRGWILRI